MKILDKDIIGIIDHAVLKQDAKYSDIQKACSDAKKYGFCSVITYPYYISEVRKLLFGSKVLCGTVIGYPFGNETLKVKTFEASIALEDGANELDMVMAISAFKDKNYNYVADDIKSIVKEAQGTPVKVIIEASLLTMEEIITACKIVVDSGAHFAKTGTGFFGSATEAMVKQMSDICFNRIEVKASGGIRTFEDAKKLINAGATRIGTSSGHIIAQQILDITNN